MACACDKTTAGSHNIKYFLCLLFYILNCAVNQNMMRINAPLKTIFSKLFF